jgi:hypothetical protein
VHQVHLVTRGTIEESRVADVARRSVRAACALSELSHSPADEQRTAAYVFGGGAFPAPAPPDARPSIGLVTADLRDRAANEAARLLAARSLTPDRCALPAPIQNRPVATRSRRRCSPVWALWLEFADADGQLIWETLAGATGVGLTAKLGGAATARALLDESWAPVGEIARACPATHEALVGLRLAAALALRRESAIARAIKSRHGRMAADLIQRALFDRRAEREALAQRELADQALARCRTRVQALQRLDEMTVAVRPAFALIS